MEESLTLLHTVHISYELIEHAAVYTIEEAERELPGRNEIKNLFLQDDKGRNFYLVMLPGHKKLDLKTLATQLDEKKVRFCSPEKVERMLGVKPGSVSLFCCLNPASINVNVIVDSDILKNEEVGMHPVVNTATVFIHSSDLQTLLSALPQRSRVLDL